jgi:hypothetical protein
VAYKEAREKLKENEMKEGFSAFPYTHGEVIEAIRA